MDFHWFLPTNGDSRELTGGTVRPVTTAYLGQIARSAEQLGFVGALTPAGAWCEDAWLSTAMLVEVTERLKFLVAFRPGLISPTLAAQMASTFQRLSGNRLLLNVVTGGESHEQRQFGDFLDKDSRYQRTGEFLTVVRALLRGETISYEGQHLRVAEARLARVPDVTPRIYFGGSSAAAGPVAAEHADVYLTWGEPPARVAEKLAWIRTLEPGMRFGIRLHVITRDTTDEAWAEAERLLRNVSPADVEAVQASLAGSESVGQQRMRELHGGDRDGLVVAPNLWAGVGLVRGGAGTALVGSHREVADRIEEYAALGITEFILSGYPHLEEAYRFGEGVLPELRRRGLWGHPAGDTPVPAAVPFTGVPLSR
ncbi:LLM class flavin-dependent oxidoreductase [Actinoplanes sp. G11-F43]|uniref:LLM class flavin-dependent oxidoreductase n=1 Tax=Actinoplanes sp. G11-F43 TaxID=3424130 RepID=UPI003D3578B7